MDVIREIVKVKDHRIVIDLPENLEFDKAEVIIQPLENSSSDFDMRAFLLKGPVLSSAEIKSIKDVRKDFKEWNLNKF